MMHFVFKTLKTVNFRISVLKNSGGGQVPPPRSPRSYGTVMTNYSTNCHANFLCLIFYLFIKKKNLYHSSRAINATCKKSNS